MVVRGAPTLLANASTARTGSGTSSLPANPAKYRAAARRSRAVTMAPSKDHTLGNK